MSTTITEIKYEFIECEQKTYEQILGEKPYKCDQCPMAFANVTRLKIHKRLHTGIFCHKLEFYVLKRVLIKLKTSLTDTK